MHVAVDQVRCVGSGQCALSVPEVFTQRPEDGVVELLMIAVPADLHADVREAQDLCPVQAIEVA